MAAALSSLAMKREDLAKVAPFGQPMSGDHGYVGIYTFK